MYIPHIRCRHRRNLYARYAREIIARRRIEARTKREEGPRGYRIIPEGRSLGAMRCAVLNRKFAARRNEEFHYRRLVARASR